MRGAVDTRALLELAWAAPLAVLVVTVAWGLVVHGATRAAEASREGRQGQAGIHALEAAGGALLFAAAVTAGLIIMTSK